MNQALTPAGAAARGRQRRGRRRRSCSATPSARRCTNHGAGTDRDILRTGLGHSLTSNNRHFGDPRVPPVIVKLKLLPPSKSRSAWLGKLEAKAGLPPPRPPSAVKLAAMAKARAAVVAAQEVKLAVVRKGTRCRRRWTRAGASAGGEAQHAALLAEKAPVVAAVVAAGQLRAHGVCRRARASARGRLALPRARASGLQRRGPPAVAVQRGKLRGGGAHA